MAIVNTKAVFESDINTVWKRVTSLTEYAWRSVISRIEILNDKQFVEYTKNGYATTFTITAAQPYKRWEFDMENENMKGHWIGVFTQIGEQIEIDFTEDVTAKKAIMKPLIKGYLEKQQAQYIFDLRKALQ
ncbi:MAG: SRPBCC family protein [Eubacteriales bacterium]|nr:SRPBCC family protein [Eubacteriales bacterium]